LQLEDASSGDTARSVGNEAKTVNMAGIVASRARPTYLHEGGNRHWHIWHCNLAANETGYLQGQSANHTNAAFAHILNASGNFC